MKGAGRGMKGRRWGITFCGKREGDDSDQNINRGSIVLSAGGNDKGEATKDYKQDMESVERKTTQSFV